MNFLNCSSKTMKKPMTRPVPSVVRASNALGQTLLALGCGLLLAAVLPRAHAGPPEAMTYQGFLVDGNGNALATNTPANYPVIFRIFAAPTGGSSLWSEQQIVTVDKGNFSVILSEGTGVGGEPKPLLSTVLSTNGADRYIEISVTIGASTSPLLPRLRFLPSPYAFLATSANNLVNPAGLTVVSYANSRVEVNGSFNASGTISGNGSGLTGITAAQLPSLDASKITTGTIPDARLSSNVVLAADNNAFIGNQTISGNLGLGTPNTTFPLTIGNNTLGDKISLFGQSGNSFGLGMQGGLLQIHSDSVGSDIGFGYGSSVAMTESMRIKGNGNVGIGTNNPTSKLTVNGGIRASGGAPGVGGINDNGYAFAGGGGDTDSGMFSSADGSLEFYTQGTEKMRILSGNVGIGTTTPTAPLEVNGAIKATSLTVNGTVTATAFAGPVNGEKAPVTYNLGTANLTLWRDVLIDGTTLLGDADGGRIKVLIRNYGDDTVRTWTWNFYCENDTDNFGNAGRWGMTAFQNGAEAYFILGTTARYDIAAINNWVWIRNYRSGQAIGGVDGPAFTAAADRYKFWMLVPPNITATVILYDR